MPKSLHFDCRIFCIFTAVYSAVSLPFFLHFTLPLPGKAGSVDDHLVDQAVALRREVPTRSIRQIIRILEMEGLVAEGQIRRSTLQDRLEERGYSSRQLRMYHSSGGGAARRFARQHRNDLWQADIKYLLVLPATAARKSSQLYVSVFIDDATRSILHAQCMCRIPASLGYRICLSRTCRI